MGGKNRPSGLYADQGWFKQTCLLPGLNQQQANTIADTICQKVPNIKRSTWRAHLTGTLVPITLALVKTQTGKLPLKP
jgi:hypothetical protein